jgi:hypothetical protein
MAELVDCPVCKGLGRVPHVGILYDCMRESEMYHAEDNTVNCENCRNFTPTKTYLRADGTPCVHELRSRQLGRCYWEYRCMHCPAKCQVDSGD